MSAPPNEVNQKYGWLAKAKFEEDKARKEKYGNPTPWSKEVWQAATAAYLAGVVEPEKRFPVIITSGSTGPPFTTRQKLQEVAGLPSLPEVQWTTVTSILDEEQEEEDEEGKKQGRRGTTTDSKSTKKTKKPERVQYCHVNWKQLVRVKDHSDGEDVMVWFQECKRYAWLARSLKRKEGGEQHVGNGGEGRKAS